MRDVLWSGYRQSLVHLAWMCLFSSMPVRGKLGLAYGAPGLALPMALTHCEWARPWLCRIFLPISRMPECSSLSGGTEAAGLGSRRAPRWGGQASMAAGQRL